MNSLVLVLISAFLTMSCIDYKSTYPKRVSGSKDANPEVDPNKPSKEDPEVDPEVVEGDDPEVDPVEPVEPAVKPCMIPESKKGQIF
ncbi:MAG: hypothetical protein EOP07_05780 [Proteobacteria bacterium]|nr:MAG: hypothetical protein EOP07_05780 [Pseudomonadota bacterium]